MKLEFSRQILEKYSNIKFHKKNLPVGDELFPRGQTDSHDEAKRRFSPFCERAQKFKNLTYILTSKFLSLYITVLLNMLKKIYVYVYFT